MTSEEPLELWLTVGGARSAFRLVRGGPPVIVGRAPDAGLSVSSPLLSRHHCEISLGALGPTVRDLGSANGTFLNGRRIQTHALAHGDLLRLGDLGVRVEIGQPSPAAIQVETRKEQRPVGLSETAAVTGELRCGQCRRLISLTTVVDDQTFEWGDDVLCPTCAEGASFAGRDAAERKVLEALAADGFTVLDRLSPGTTLSPVFKARRFGLGDLVAIKTLPVLEGITPRKLERFKTEARAMAQIKHPNVVHVYDVRQKPELIYLVLEFIEGESLLARLERDGRLPLAQGLRVGLALARALEAAAKHGIVHRNVKPANILLASEDGTPKLVDFGLAKDVKSFDESITSEDDTVGTMRYMAPEQVRDARAADPRSDVFSLAATLFQALSGKLPYPDRTEVDLLRRFGSGRLPAFDPTGTEGIPADIAAVLARALTRDPKDRTASATAFREDLAAAIAKLSSDLGVAAVDDLLNPRSPATPAAPGVISGVFEKAELAELVQMLGLNGKTGVLEIRSGQDGGKIFFVDGKVVAARTRRDATGEAAAHELLALRSGDFEFRPGLHGGLATGIAFGVEGLLMEALRRRDERG